MCTPGPCDDVAGIIRDRRRSRPPAAPFAVLATALALAAPGFADESAALAERVARAQKAVERVRGVPFRAPVASALLPASRLPEVLGRKLVEDLPVPFETYAASLASVGLIDPSPGLLSRLTRLYTRQVVGFYDPAEKRFFVVPERSSDVEGPTGELLERLLLAHELTHALQDQRLDLDRRMKGLRDSTDALLALQAFLEGEATILMTDVLLESLPEEAREAIGGDPVGQLLDGLGNPESVEGAEGVPDFFVKELVFPYAAGTEWVRRKKREGGWPAVDAVYDRLPATTREILHPGAESGERRLLAPSDLPVKANAPAGSGAAWTDTLGEWVLGTLLERAGAGEEAADVAATWRDDRVLFFAPKRRPAGQGVGFLWRIRTSDAEGALRIAALLDTLYAPRPASVRPVVTARGDVVEVSRGLPARARPRRGVSPG